MDMIFFQRGHKAHFFILLALASLSLNAENICNEAPPAGRAVDGIPAYAQCSTSTGNVYSNNGIDTRSTSGGTGWVRTQMGGGYQCTELAFRYLAFHWNIKSAPTGNAGTWGDNTLPAGLVKTTTPIHGDIIVFAPGSCGASTTTGHVAIIDSVKETTLSIVEQNGAARRKCQASCAKYFLHAQANTGLLFAGRAMNAPNEDAGLSVRRLDHGILIRVNGEASIQMFDLAGRLVADLTDRILAGQIDFKTGDRSPSAMILVVRKANQVLYKRILLHGESGVR
jgi:surface antigen